jgi:SAM-dependent methyltransferase
VAVQTVRRCGEGERVEPLPEANVGEIMRQVRERAARQRQKFSLSSAANPHHERRMAEDLSFLQSAQDIAQVHFNSHRKVVGDLIVFAKKVLRQLLTPIWERQSAYNAANARLMIYLCDRVARMEARVIATLEALGAEEATGLDGLRQTVSGQLEDLPQQQAAALQVAQREVASQSRRRRAQEQDLMRSLDEVRNRLSELLPQQTLQTLATGETCTAEAFFATFDAQFRGSRADIKERRRVYLPTLTEAQIGMGDSLIVDLGCGRGEWLEVLHEEGLQGKGVDGNPMLVEECRRYKLDVVESEILTYLRSAPDGSIGGVTGFHIIEYLPFDALLNLFDETARVLQPGGVAIFETPNPQNVVVSTHEFFLDPRRRTPLPSPLLKFIAEVKGLHRIQVLPLEPFPEAVRVQEAGLEVAKRFNELFYGPRDYALIGWKA